MPIIHQQKAAAAALQITPRALRDWSKEPGFPDCSGGYDLDAIRRWRDERDRKGSAAGQQTTQLNLALKAQKLRCEKIKADAAERDEEIARGNILPRDEWELSLRESIQVTRDRLSAIPKELCRLLPKKYHRQLQTEGTKLVDNILREFARLIERGNAD